MRAAPAEFSTQFLSYTYFDLPRSRDSALTTPPPPGGAAGITPRTVGAPQPGTTPGSSPQVLSRIMDSPYARTYRLARRLAAGQPTTYDVVRSVERHLERGFTYDERPPLRRIPLDAFLFHDKIGYCQQFSGAMALLLRMDGIPARVASGFAPGVLDPATKEYRVRDLDAHSWVEVWFQGAAEDPRRPGPSCYPRSACRWPGSPRCGPPRSCVPGGSGAPGATPICGSCASPWTGSVTASPPAPRCSTWSAGCA
jgi:transglutaminase-like putative cysteine protease